MKFQEEQGAKCGIAASLTSKKEKIGILSENTEDFRNCDVFIINGLRNQEMKFYYMQMRRPGNDA